MDTYQTVITNPIFYVYSHVDPNTEEIVYIGKGSRGRAWHCAESNSRGVKHALWMTTLINQGFTPEAWVKILHSSLYEKEAFETELEYINELAPIFNSKKDSACKLSDNDLDKIKILREEGLSYFNIGLETGFSTMTIYRALNGLTKNYK